MTNTTTPAESMEAPPAAASYYRWEPPDKPIVIDLSLDLIDRLERDVLESFKAVTKRGSEIGGVLIGRCIPGPKRRVIIDGFEPVECDYSRGPLYLLSDEDKVRLQQALDRVKKLGNGSTAAGFFRSNTRRELVLDEDDLAIANESFSDPNHVILLVRPYAMKPSAGGFFFWENGRINGEETYLQFPFKRGELAKSFEQFLVSGPGGSAEEPAKEPLVMPKREERAPATPNLTLKREEPKPAPVAPQGASRRPEPVAPPPAALKREEPKPSTPLSFKREERPPIVPSISKREEPVLPKREDRGPASLGIKREERPTPPPLHPRRDDRPGGPTLVSKREETPVVQPVKKEEKSTPAVQKRDERPAITVKREEKPAVAPVVTRREEPPKEAAVKKEEKPAAVVVETAPAVKQEPVRDAEKELAASIRSLGPSFAEASAGQPGFFSRMKWLIVTVLILLVVVGGGFFGWRALQLRTQQSASSMDSGLGLKVERFSGQLLLSWNREAALISSATRATLTINDGDHKEDVDLDLGQLRTGSVAYAPMTNDVSFRLEITDLKHGKSLSESVRVLAGRPSPTVAAETPSAAKPAPLEAEKAAPSAAAPAPGTPAQSAAAPAAEQTAEEPKVVAGMAVTAAPPKPESLAARLRAPEPQELPAPPTLEGSGASFAARPPIGSSSSIAAPAPPPVQRQAPAAQAPQQQAAQQPAAPIRTGGVAVPARLVSRTNPFYPPLARQARVSGIVRVQATIGADGKVKRAVAVSGPQMLRRAATDAVLRWQYTPATVNGQVVESETTADLNFIM